MSTFIYISNSGEDKIAICSFAPETGALTPSGSTKAPGNPAQLVMTPDRNTLIVGLRASYQIAAFRRDAASGGLTPHATLSLDSDPDCLCVDSSGRFLFSTYPNAEILAIHAIDVFGKFITLPVAWLEMETYISAVRVDRSNRFVFLLQPDARQIAQCLFDEQNGTLRPNDMPFVNCEQPPYHLCFHPFEPLAYVSDEAGNIAAYRLHLRAGRLELTQELTLFPAGFPGLGGSRIVIAPNGRLLFSLNRERGEIACVMIDSATNQLSAGSRLAIPALRDLAVAPSGKALFALSERGEFSVCAIDFEHGDLRVLESLPVGKSPRACLIV
ncbi:hypothetical protein U14_03173 [Candidatus Moduliflexus flocculans]|uniref:6-phosphogluconolactonase n=1 Tax=Candidatus Moduliflexus flocculans TaxID=1499966 RepID=A0A081BNG1_9BACT|nr:hypothetical protein U14_03173 [Candidatus Moduliflexus flocculans]